MTNPGVGTYIGEDKDDVQDYLDNSLAESKTTPNAAVCPVDTPYSTGTDCVACDGDTPYFNIKTKKCENCEGNSLYDEDNSRCKECPEGYAVDENKT